MGAAISVYTDLLASGAAFRQRFTAGDIREVSAARFCFHATSLAPALLYYLRLGADARRPKFPATISWTIRAGAPFRVHHALWACGWALMLRVLRRRGDSRLLAFAAQMVATGAMTTGVCALGQTGNRFASAATIDQMHMVCAAFYMLDHHVLIRVLDVSPAYARAYYAAFATMLAAMGVARRLFAWDESTYVASAMTSSASSSASASAVTLTSATGAARPAWLLFALELVVMVCENALFFSFVAGMTSGLRAAATEGGGDAAAPLKDDATQKRIEQTSSVALSVDAVMQQQQQQQQTDAAGGTASGSVDGKWSQ